MFGYVRAWLVLAGSRSESPEIFGRYSLPLFVLVLVSALPVAGAVLWLGLARGRVVSILERFLHRLSTMGSLLEWLAFLGIPAILLLRFTGSALIPLAGDDGFAEGLVILILAVVSGGIAAAGPGRARLFGGRACMSICSVLLGILLLEIALRILTPARIFHPALDLRPNIRLQIQNGDLPGVSRTGVFSTNRWGMRGEEPPEDWREWQTIVCVGGSTTRCCILDDERTWPWLLQEDLRRVNPRTWVGNAGVPGHSTVAHVVLMQEVIPRIEPDFVIFLIGLNERGNFDLEPASTTRAYRHHDQEMWTWIFRHSRIVQTAYYLRKAYIDKVPVVGNSWPFRMDTEPLPEPELTLPSDLHDLLVDPDLTKSNVRRMIELARENGAVPIILTQPLLYEDTPRWRSILDNNIHPRDGCISAATLARLVNMVNQDIIDVCVEEGADYYDLSSAIPNSEDLYYGGIHYSEAGAALIADSVSAYLIRRGFIHDIP